MQDWEVDLSPCNFATTHFLAGRNSLISLKRRDWWPFAAFILHVYLLVALRTMQCSTFSHPPNWLLESRLWMVSKSSCRIVIFGMFCLSILALPRRITIVPQRCAVSISSRWSLVGRLFRENRIDPWPRCFWKVLRYILLGNSMTIRFGNLANFIVGNFVVIWEAPNLGDLQNVPKISGWSAIRVDLVAPSTGWMLYYLCFTPSTAIGRPLR